MFYSIDLIVGSADPYKIWAMSAPRDSGFNLIESDHYFIYAWRANGDDMCSTGEKAVQVFRMTYLSPQFFYPGFIHYDDKTGYNGALYFGIINQSEYDEPLNPNSFHAFSLDGGVSTECDDPTYSAFIMADYKGKDCTGFCTFVGTTGKVNNNKDYLTIYNDDHHGMVKKVSPDINSELG